MVRSVATLTESGNMGMGRKKSSIGGHYHYQHKRSHQQLPKKVVTLHTADQHNGNVDLQVC